MTDKFCKFCGATHTGTAFPLHCGACNTTTWFSPSPVAVILQTVMGNDGNMGVLIGRRNIEPGKGKWALPGGFIDSTDLTAQAAAARELHEETGFEVQDPDTMTVTSTFSDGRHFLIFVENMNYLTEEEVRTKFVPNSECEEVMVVYEPVDLCFPAHTEALRQCLEVNRVVGLLDEADDMDFEDEIEDEELWR